MVVLKSVEYITLWWFIVAVENGQLKYVKVDLPIKHYQTWWFSIAMLN